MDNLKELPQYFIDRDLFIKLVNTIIPNLEDIMSDNGYDFETDNFKIFRIEDEFYILHLPSGTMINWYKHLGRTNTCNKNLSIDEYMKLLEMIKEEIV